MYTTEDVFKLIIQVEERAAVFYHTFSQEQEIERNLKTLALVLAAEERRHQKLYGELMMSSQHSEVPVDLYHRSSQLLSRFRPTFQGQPQTTGDLLTFAITLERENLALVIRLRDLLREREGQEELLDQLDSIVKEEESHVDQLVDVLEHRGRSHA